MTQLGPALLTGLLGDIFDPSNSGAGLGVLDTVLGITGNAPIYYGAHSARPISVQTSNELSYAGTTPYNRFQAARNSSGTVHTVDQINYAATNFVAVTFPSHSVAGPTALRYISVGTKALSASAPHPLIAISPLIASGAQWHVARCIDTSTDTVSVPIASHTAFNIAAGDEVAIERVYDDALPTPLALTDVLFVKTGTLSVNTYDVTFQLATGSAGGTAVNFTSTLSFQMIKMAPLSLVAGSTPSFSPGTIRFRLA